ncbi:MAG TPA: DUF4163 domain-containing protein, partial [Leptospiraceae bacterium]|nr:DUF4163 domain-containing protein [Leptospiraceae bacterium]
SQSKEPLSIDGKVLDKKEKNCSYKIKYPILKLGKDSKYDVSVVRNIGKVFIDEFTNIEKYENEFECNKKDKNASPFTLNGDFTVKLKTDSILSIHSSFSSYVEGNPYPNNVFKTYNFELNSGKEIAFEDLFKKDSKYLIPLHKFMAEAMLKEKVISEKDEFIALKKEKYDFYLTQNAIVFINLFDIHAMQSVEVMIPYDKMKKYLNTDMVLKFVK